MLVNQLTEQLVHALVDLAGSDERGAWSKAAADLLASVES